MNSTIGKKVKELRKELNMTQAELAEPEMTKSMLSHIEKGYSNPSMKSLQFIANKLNKPIAYFLEDESTNITELDYNSNLPIDTIMNELSNIDDAIQSDKYEFAINKIKELLRRYDFNTGSKLYGDIVFRLACCYIHIGEFNEGERNIHICLKIYTDNKLYIEASKTYLKLLKKHTTNYDYDKCIDIIDKCYDLYNKSTSKDIFLEIQLLIFQPMFYFAVGDFDKTINICKKAIAISHKNNIYYMLDDAYRTIALTYLIKEDYNNFLINLDAAKKYADFTGKELNKVKIIHNYAKYENMVNNPQEALKYLNEYDTNCYKKTFYYYLEHGKAQYLLGNYEEALSDFFKITYKEEIKYLLDRIYILTSKIYKGLIYSKLKQFDKAINELENVIKEFDAYSNIKYKGFLKYMYKQLSFAYESLSEVYSIKNDFQKAYSLLKKSNELKEKNVNTASQIML